MFLASEVVGRMESRRVSRADAQRGRRSRLLSARDAAAYLGISLATLAQIERKGFLSPYRTPGGHRRYSREMLERYLEESLRFETERRKASKGAESVSR